MGQTVEWGGWEVNREGKCMLNLSCCVSSKYMAQCTRMVLSSLFYMLIEEKMKNVKMCKD